ALFFGFAGLILKRASDDIPPVGGAREGRARRHFFAWLAASVPAPGGGGPTLARSTCLTFDTPIGRFRWGARGSNSYGLCRPPDPKSGASTSSASPPPQPSGGVYFGSATARFGSAQGIPRSGSLRHVPRATKKSALCRLFA